MARIVGAALIPALLMTAACAERDYGSLPKDAKERAMLCTRAGVMLIGTTPDADKARLERVSDKARKLANKDDFYTLFPSGNDDPASALGSEEAIQSAVGYRWLSAVNQCFKAYGMDEEPVPALPTDPYDRALTCAAASALDTLGPRAMNPEARITYDPQAGYYVHRAIALSGGSENFVKATDAATDRLPVVLKAGTADIWARQCATENPKAVKAEIRLPEDESAALLICDDALSFAREGGLAAGSSAQPAAKRYAAAYARVDAKLKASPAANAGKAAYDAAVQAVAEGGRLDQIGDACIARFGG